MFIENEETRFNFNQLKCLAFVPPNKVIECFKMIKRNSSEEFTCMLTYFENYYIAKCKKNTNGIRALPPFPKKTWNCY